LGDRLFELISGDKEAQKAFDELQQDSLWNSLPGVKNNKVRFIEDNTKSQSCINALWLFYFN